MRIILNSRHRRAGSTGRPVTRAVLALAATLTVGAGAGSWGAAGAAGVSVHRGAAISPANLRTAAGTGSVEIVRGPSVRPVVPPRHPTGDQPVLILSGEQVWFVDPEEGILRACAMQNSTQVGRRLIRCATRALPD